MKEKLKILTYTLTFLVKIDFKYISLVLIKSVLFGIMPVINLKLTQVLIDSLTRGQEIEFIKILILISVFTCLSDLVGFSIKKIEDYSLLEINKFINIDILNKIKKLDAKKLETSQTYDIINRVREDFTVAMLDSLNIMLDVFSAIIASLSYIVIVLSYNIFFLVILIVPIIRFLVEKKYVILEYKNRLDNTQSEIRKNYIYAMTSDSENFKELKVYKAFDYFICIFKQLSDCINNTYKKIFIKKYRSLSVLSILEIFVDFFVSANLGLRTFNGVISLGDFVLYNNSIDNMKNSLFTIFLNGALLNKNLEIIEMGKEFFELDEEMEGSGKINIEAIDNIVIKGLSYSYNQNKVLSNIDLRFEKNKSYTIMGENGSGKSTLLKILMGIYGDYGGHIYVNGIDFSEIDIFSYRNRLNVMFQNYIKYRSSIKENIFLDKNAKDEEVSKYLSSLGMDGLIDDINSNLGYEFDGGRWLSEGQWQKLDFLRLINKEWDMYLLDEPSASLDIVSERKLLNILEKISGIKIMICHRFNEYTLKSDEIIMLKDGEIIAKGNHNQMLNICEDYREMYKIYIGTYCNNKSTDVL